MDMKTPINVKYSSILINYDDCIKCGDFFIFEMIKTHYREQFKNFISLKILDLMDTEPNFKLIYFSRLEQNPFKWLSITEFDYEDNYNYFKKKYKNMYINSDSLDLAKDVVEFLKSYLIKDIYFYSKEYDERIDFDILSLFNSNPKIKYVTGDLDAAIDKFNIEAVFYPYMDEELIKLARKNKHVIFSIPNYGFNMQDSSNLRLVTDDDENIGFYPVLKNKKPLFFG